MKITEYRVMPALLFALALVPAPVRGAGDPSYAAFVRSLSAPAETGVPSAAPSAGKFASLDFERGSGGSLRVGVHRNILVLSAIQQLGPFGEVRRKGRTNPQIEAVLAGLKEFREYPAVVLTGPGQPFSATNTVNLNTGNMASYAMHFSPLPEGKKLSEYSDELLDSVLEMYTKEQKIKFLDYYWEQVKDFYARSGFDAFYRAQAPGYQALVASVYANLPGEDLTRLHQEYHGFGVKGFNLVPSPLNLPVGGSFAPDMEGEVYDLMGYGFDDEADVKYLGLHEFGHAFCNPTVAAHLAEARNYAWLLEGIKEEMTGQSYRDWQAVMSEQLVRAVHARLLLKTEGRQAAEGFLFTERYMHKFVFTDDFYRLLEDYENDRARYPRLSDFYPRLLAALGDWELREVTEPAYPGLWVSPARDGLLVEFVEKDSLGEKAGLLEGDTVLLADGEKPAREFFYTADCGRAYALKLRRADGSYAELQYSPLARTLKRPVRKTLSGD